MPRGTNASSQGSPFRSNVILLDDPLSLTGCAPKKKGRPKTPKGMLVISGLSQQSSLYVLRNTRTSAVIA